MSNHTVSIFAVSAGGAVTPVGTPVATGTEPISVAFSPVGGLLAIANYFSSNIRVFSVSSGGGLTPVGAAIPTGATPRSIAFGPTGSLLATANSADNTVSVFSGGGPTAQIAAPADQQIFAQNQMVATSFACTAPTGSGAVSSCVDSNGGSSPGGTLDTSTLGAHTYTVTATSNDTLTSSSTIHYTVTAATAPNPPAAPTPPTPAPTPKPNGCPTATGALSGATLGLIRLGMTRAQAISQYAESSSNGKPNWQFFCVSPRIIRAGFPSPQLLKTLSSTERQAVAGRVVIALTANRSYNLKGIRSGMSLRTAAKQLHTGPVFHVGKNDCYMAPTGSTTAIIKVRQGSVEQIGTANKRLTRNRTAQRTFITSFS